MSSQRLQKVLAQAGVASRRAAEALITEGRVRVNGRIVRELGARANLHKDRVEVDGRRLVAQRHVYFLMHKPRGVVTTLDDPEGRKTVKDLLRSVHERVFPVGRLDFQTSGALLLTNDGDLAQALLHPTRAVPKTYNAKLEGKLDQERLEGLRGGVVLDDGHKTAPAEVKVLRTDDKATSIEITIAEGKNRQIHRMGEAIGRAVLRLTRISFAGLTLEGLRPGQMRPLTARELTDLKETYLHKAPKRRKYAPKFGAEAFEEASGQLAFSSPDEQNAWGTEEEPTWGDDEGARNTGAEQPRADGFNSRRTSRARHSDPRNEYSKQPRKTRTADPRNDYGAQPRKTRSADARNEYGTAPRKTRGADARNEYGTAPRKTRGADPRNEYGTAPRKTRGADPRNEYGTAPRKTRGADPRNEYGAPSRKTRGADPRNEYGTAPRKTRGADPRNEYGTAPRKTRGPDPRNEYGTASRKTRGADARDEYGTAPRKTRGADPRNEYSTASRKTRGADPRNDYGTAPRKTRGADARNEHAAQPRKTRGVGTRNKYGAQQRKKR